MLFRSAIDKLNGIVGNLDKLVEEGILSPAMSAKVSSAIFAKAEKKRAHNVATIMAKTADPYISIDEKTRASLRESLIASGASSDQLQVFDNKFNTAFIKNAKLIQDPNSITRSAFNQDSKGYTKIITSNIESIDGTDYDKSKLYIQYGAKFGSSSLIAKGVAIYTPQVKALFQKGGDLGGIDVQMLGNVLALLNDNNALVQAETATRIGPEYADFLKAYSSNIVNTLRSKSGDIQSVLSGIRDAYNNTEHKFLFNDGVPVANVTTGQLFGAVERHTPAGQSVAIMNSITADINDPVFMRMCQLSLYKDLGISKLGAEHLGAALATNKQVAYARGTRVISPINMEKSLFKTGEYDPEVLVGALDESRDIRVENGASIRLNTDNYYYKYDPNSDCFYINFTRGDDAIQKEVIPMHKVMKNYRGGLQRRRNAEAYSSAVKKLVILAGEYNDN